MYEFANPCLYLLVFVAHKKYEFFYVIHMSKIWNACHLGNRFSLSVCLMVQSIRKCLSSSRTWQIKQLGSSIFVSGRVCLPYSIARVYELVLNWDMATVHLWFLIESKYISHAKILLEIVIDSQNRITVSVLNFFCPCSDEPICYTLFAFRFEFNG